MLFWNFRTSPYPVALNLLICQKNFENAFPFPLVPNLMHFNTSMKLHRTSERVWNSIRISALEIHMFGLCIFPGVRLCHYFRPLVPSLPSLSWFIWLCLFSFCLCGLEPWWLFIICHVHPTSWKVHVVSPFETIIQVTFIVSCSACRRRRGNQVCISHYSLWHGWNVSQILLASKSLFLIKNVRHAPLDSQH